MLATKHKQRRWTLIAKECFNRQCACNGCYYQTCFTDKYQKCQMKKAVIKLILDLGMPNNFKAPTFKEDNDINTANVILNTKLKCKELFDEKHVNYTGKWVKNA